MADIHDMEKLVAEYRRLMVTGGADGAVRAYDGVTHVLLEILLELRKLNEKMDARDASDA